MYGSISVATLFTKSPVKTNKSGCRFLIFSILLSCISFFFTLHQSAKSNENFKILLYTLKNDYSSSLLQEGTFNNFGKDFTIFVKERKKDGLHNVFIHDTRDEKRTSTLIAKKGRLITHTDSTKILLQNGSQHFQGKDKKLSVLYFEEYLLDVNQNDQTNLLNRWKSPSERSLYELKNPDFIQLSKSLGAKAIRTESIEEFSVVFPKVLASNKLTVIEIPISIKQLSHRVTLT